LGATDVVVGIKRKGCSADPRIRRRRVAGDGVARSGAIHQQAARFKRYYIRNGPIAD
jgi:hypothetical protein